MHHKQPMQRQHHFVDVVAFVTGMAYYVASNLADCKTEIVHRGLRSLVDYRTQSGMLLWFASYFYSLFDPPIVSDSFRL